MVYKSKYFNISKAQRVLNTNKPIKYLIIYDITNNKIRVKIAKILIAYGATRIQKSSFEILATKNKIALIFKELTYYINTDEGDSLIGYRVDDVNKFRFGAENFDATDEPIIFY